MALRSRHGQRERPDHGASTDIWGMHVLRDNQKLPILSPHKGVIGIGKLVHSYPHSGGQRRQ